MSKEAIEKLEATISEALIASGWVFSKRIEAWRLLQHVLFDCMVPVEAIKCTCGSLLVRVDGGGYVPTCVCAKDAVVEVKTRKQRIAELNEEIRQHLAEDDDHPTE